jgi:proline iminopeptidase
MNRKTALAAVILLAGVYVTGSCQSQTPVEGEGYVDVTGGTVWYQVVGNGPGTPLLVVHGGPRIPHYYLKPLAGLGKYRPVIFYDQLGCGKSTAPDDTSLWRIHRFVTELGEVRRALGSKKSTSMVTPGARCWRRNIC